MNHVATKPKRELTSENPLYVRSVEKPFSVLTAFDGSHPTQILSQIAVIAELDKSAAQRFTLHSRP